MSATRLYDKPIDLEIRDEDTEAWTQALHLHARVNNASADVRLRAGASEDSLVRTFDVRYCAALEPVKLSPQLYRVLYRDGVYRVRGADDFEERHETVRITGERYDG